MMKPNWQFNLCRDDAVVAVLRDCAAPGTLSEDRKIFFCHKQTVLGEFDDLMFQFVHRVGVSQTIG